MLIIYIIDNQDIIKILIIYKNKKREFKTPFNYSIFVPQDGQNLNPSFSLSPQLEQYNLTLVSTGFAETGCICNSIE